MVMLYSGSNFGPMPQPPTGGGAQPATTPATSGPLSQAQSQPNQIVKSFQQKLQAQIEEYRKQLETLRMQAEDQVRAVEQQLAAKRMERRQILQDRELGMRGYIAQQKILNQQIQQGNVSPQAAGFVPGSPPPPPPMPPSPLGWR